MAKPAGASCNLRCRYCYYLGSSERRKAPASGIMSDETLETYIRQYIEGNPGPELTFFWHGGEPLLSGLDFYKKAVALEKKYCPEGLTVYNNIQTNGTLLNDEWCAFFKEERFDVGLSIDGAGWLHDEYRIHGDGRGSYDEAVRGIALLKKHGILPDLLSTVTLDSCRKPLNVYNALKSFHTGWVQFIPIVVKRGLSAAGETLVTEESVTPEAYGRFLIAVFDEWASHDLGTTDVQLFSEIAGILAGNPSHLCMLSPVCGQVAVLEWDGKVYSCDHFVDEAHCIGDIRETPLRELMELPRQKAFGEAKSSGLPETCVKCPYLSLCNGGCLKDRFLPDGRYYLCEGLRRFFDHSVPVLKMILEETKRGTSAGNVMAKVRSLLKKKRLEK